MTATADNAETITFVHHSNSNGTGILLETGHHQNPENTAQSKIVSADSGIKIWGPAPAGARWTAEAVTVPAAVTVNPDALTLTIGETPANNTLTAALTGENITAGFDALEWTAGEGLTLAEVTDQPLQRTVTLADNAAAGTAKVTVSSTLKGLNLTSAEATVTINAASSLLPLVSTEGKEHYYAIKAIRNTSQNGNNNPEDLSGSYIRPTISETALTRQNAIDDYAVMIFETAEGVEIPAGFSMAVKIKNIKTGKYFGGTIKYNQLNLTDAAGATTWYLTTGNASANGTDYEGVMMANLDQSGNNYLDAGGYANLDYWQPNTMGSLWIMEPETIPSGVTIALGEQELLTSTEAQTVTVTPTWTPDNLNDAFKTLTYAVTTGEGDNKTEAEGFTVTGGNLTVPANAAAGTYTVTATTFNHIETTATLTINDRVLDVTEIALDAATSTGITDGTVTLGTQTAADAWTAKNVTLAFRVKITESSKTPEASDFTVASDNAALAVAENGVAVSGPDDTEYYTVTVSATAVAPAELVKLSVNTLQVPLQIAKPAVSIKSITVSATGLTDGEITIGEMTDATADGVTYAPSAEMDVTAAIELDEVSSWPTAADIAASVDAENAAGIAPSTFTPAVTRNDDGTFTATIGTVTASKVGTSTITVIQEVTEGEGKYATLNITGVAPVVSVDEVTAPEAATVTLTKDAEGTIGASAEQTAVFNVFTDHPTTMVEVPAVTSSEGIEIIGTPVVALTTTEGGTATFGVSFTATVNYRAKADASAAETLTVSYGEVSATLDITVVTPVTGISAEAAAATIILGENGEATTTISGEISPEAANFTADQITAEVNASEGLTVAGALKGEGNSFTMDVTATKAGYYTVTVSYVKGEETIAAAPIRLYVSNPAPENGITVSAPATMPEDVDIEVSEAEAGEPQTVSIALNSPAETHQIVLPVEQQFVNIHTLYDVVYADNNAEGASIEAYLLANNDGTASVILTNKEGAEVPFNTVIKVVEKNATSRAAGNTVIVINASINAAKIESVSINGGRSIEVYLNQTLTLTAETEPASDNEVTYVVTDSKGNVVEPVAPGQYVFTVEGTYTVTATVTGTVPAVTATAVIRVLNATGNPGEGVSGIEAVNMDAANGKATIYDLAGRRLTRINAAGIYIVNGVKTLVR